MQQTLSYWNDVCLINGGRRNFVFSQLVNLLHRIGLYSVVVEEESNLETRQTHFTAG